MSSDKKINEFSGLRGIFWPVYNYELKKFLPMCFMMMCILFNYTLIRDLKDALIVNAPCSGAETISFLKLYGVTPAAILFMVFFVKLANVMEREKLFYSIVSFFVIFFGVFGFFIYPLKDILHFSPETIKGLQESMPNFHWFIPVFGNWSYSIFYILAELWGSVVLSMLFWQFANEITKVTEAKRIYGLFGMLGNIGLIFSGGAIMLSSWYAKSLPEGSDSFSTNLKFLMGAFAFAGICILYTYYWMNRHVLTDPTLYQPGEGTQKKKKPKLSIGESFKYILSNPYLGLIAVLVLSYGVAINLVEGVWKNQIKVAFKGNHNDYTAFMGQFSMWTGIITILLMVIGNNILRRLSWLTAAIITPIMVAVTSAIFFFVVWKGTSHDPFSAMLGTTVVMVAVIVGQIQNVLSKGTKYSLFDSTKQMAYIPLDPEAKVKGQAAVEVIGGRAGKSGGAFIQSTLLAVVGGSVSLASLAYLLGPLVLIITFVWILSVFGLNKRFTALVQQEK